MGKYSCGGADWTSRLKKCGNAGPRQSLDDQFSNALSEAEG